MPDITPNPRRRARRCWAGVGWSLGGSLTLSKLQNANKKRGAFWVISIFFSEEAPICVMSLGVMGMKLVCLPCATSRQHCHLHDDIGFP